MDITWIYIHSMDCVVLWIRPMWIQNFEEFQGIFSAKLVSKNIQYHLEDISFSNTLIFALIMLVLQITIVKEWKSWCSCFSQLHWGSFHCCHWCGILSYHDHATNQISCKNTSSCCLKHSHKNKLKMWAHDDLISTGFMEQTISYLHINFLSNLMILKYWHKLA